VSYTDEEVDQLMNIVGDKGNKEGIDMEMFYDDDVFTNLVDFGGAIVITAIGDRFQEKDYQACSDQKQLKKLINQRKDAINNWLRGHSGYSAKLPLYKDLEGEMEWVENPPEISNWFQKLIEYFHDISIAGKWKSDSLEWDALDSMYYKEFFYFLDKIGIDYIYFMQSNIMPDLPTSFYYMNNLPTIESFESMLRLPSPYPLSFPRRIKLIGPDHYELNASDPTIYNQLKAVWRKS